MPFPPLKDESPRPGGVALPEVVPLEHDVHDAQPPTMPVGRWCPFCGADLSGVPVQEEHADDAAFAIAGRRLKVALAVGLLCIWLVSSLYDWLEDPATVLLPGWWSALGVVLLAWLLGVTPWGILRRRG